MSLTLEEADRIIEGARRKATDMGIAVAIVVVDAGGHLVALKRMDGAGFHTVDIARDKAFTAAAFGRDTAQLSQMLGQIPFFASGAQVSGGRLLPVGGGVPICQGDDVVGAVGVSGSSADNDSQCAQAGLMHR